MENTLISGSLKNMKGIIEDKLRIKMHEKGICESLADMNKILYPDFTIFDAISGIEGYGPF